MTQTKTASLTQHPQELQDQLNDRAEAFSKEFANAGYAMGQAQNFVSELCGVYGLNYLRSVDFERRVAKYSCLEMIIAISPIKACAA